MKTLLSIVLAFVFVVPLSDDLENGWKGLKVFESSRADVEKRLGKPTEVVSGVEVRYKTDRELIRILYSAAPCSGINTVTGGYSVNQDTIVQYSVTMLVDLPISEFKWDQKKYVRNIDGHSPRILTYTNRKDGIFFQTTLLDDGKTETVRTFYFYRNPDGEKTYGCK